MEKAGLKQKTFHRPVTRGVHRVHSHPHPPQVPATSCECERSASSLRRLHTYNRACMGQERLPSLALMHIHCQVKIVLDEVVNLFATKHLLRLELGTILRD